MSPHHHYSRSHPTTAAKRHVKYPSDVPSSLVPLTPPLTPSSSINNNDNPDDDDKHTRIITLSNLNPTLDPSLLEQAIHDILSPPSSDSLKLRIKGLNTRTLSTTHTVPIVFFDKRDARTLFDAIREGTTSSLDAFGEGGNKVQVQMISIEQLFKDLGPSPFLDAIDASFRLRVTPTEDKKINLNVVQNLLSSFGEMCKFSKIESETLIYQIEYFDSRDGHRAVKDLHRATHFGFNFFVEHLIETNSQFLIGPPGSLSNLRVRFRTPDFPDPDQSNPTLLYASSPTLSPSLIFDPVPCPTESGIAPDILADTDHHPDSATTSTASQLDLDTGATPNEPAIACYADSQDGVCFYCPCPSRLAGPSGGDAAHPHGPHLQPPPPPPPPPISAPQGAISPVMPSYGHYSEPTIPPNDSGLVYYPSLSVTSTPTPPTTTGSYEYFDSHYPVMQGHAGLSLPASPAPPGVAWGGYDPSVMMPLHMGMNMGMGMVSLPMSMNMNMGVGMGMGMLPPPPPPPHGYYPMPRGDETGAVGGGSAGRGYIGPYVHGPPPPPPRLQYPVGPGMNVNGGASGVYAHQHQHQPHNQNQRFSGVDDAPSLSVEPSCRSAGPNGGGKGNGNGRYAYQQERQSPAAGVMAGTRTGLGLNLGTSGGAGRTSWRGVGYKERDNLREREERREGDCFDYHACPRKGLGALGAPQTPSRYDDGDNDDDDDDSATPLHIPGSVDGSTSATNTPTSATPTVGAGAGAPSERNQLNIKRIEDGVDTRTTVMIKNIPNKMSDRDLMSFIEKVCPRRIDFFYLRMDFQNGCNVGYAFVNFIHVQDLLRFAKARLGVKWNMFSSEKVLQMSYANYQGKEALVEKFKNSAIMDEREAWRPRIFFSAGANQGLPEPFPPPTHMRRKERSFFNRGALFVPGSLNHHHHHHGGGGSGGEGGRRACVRAGEGTGTGTSSLAIRGLAGVGVGELKSWMGRAAAARGGVSDVEEEEREEKRGV